MDTNPNIKVLNLCEQKHTILKADVLYRFVVDPTCALCVALHNEYPIQVGDRVRLKGKKQVTTVLAGMNGQYRGGFHLKEPLGNCRYWNGADLERV